MGPSGAGKTTLLQVLGGLITPSSGRSTLSESTTHAVAWIVQNSPLLPRRTCQENVAIGALGAGEEWDKAQILAGAILGEVGLSDSASVAAFKLSGGEKQRVAVARAMATGAPLILADEPTASLDARSRTLVCEALTRAARKGCSVVVTTHDPQVADTADAIFWLEDGQLTAHPSSPTRLKDRS